MSKTNCMPAWAPILVFMLIFSPYSGVNAATAFEKNTETNDVMNLTLEELLNTEVEVAGKKNQKIKETSAIVSVITAEELHNMGVSNLYEALSYIPGVTVYETFFGFSSVTFRGNVQTHYNNKSLVLINNHPAHETPWGTFYLEQTPIAMIKRIEIIRGPGSTLYGTNAFAGVIKIITADGADLNGVSLNAGAGSYQHTHAGLTAGKVFGDFNIAVSGSFLNSSGFPFRLAADEEKKAGAIDYENDYLNGMLSMKYKNLTLNAGYFNARRDKFGLTPTFVSTGERNLKGFFMDAGYKWKVSEPLEVSIFAYYDRLGAYEDIEWYPPQQALKDQGIGEKEYFKKSGSKYGAEIQASYDFSEFTRLMGGVLYENQHTEPFLWYKYGADTLSLFGSSSYLKRYDSYDVSGYLQLDSRLFSKLGLVAGIRYNYNGDYGSKIVPRGGLVYSFSKDLSVKLLYGMAFRNPNFFEKYCDTRNVLYGNPELKPEQISTLDIGVDFSFLRKNNLRLNYFFTSTKDLITRGFVVPTGGRGNIKPTPQYGNSAGQDFQGLEAEVKGELFSGVRYFANASLVTGTEKNNGADIHFLPSVSGNMGFHLKMSESVTFSPFLQYMGKKDGKLANQSDFSTDAYFLINMMLRVSLLKNLSISLIGKNMGDAEYMQPEYIRRIIPQIPGGPGRTIYMEMSLDL